MIVPFSKNQKTAAGQGLPPSMKPSETDLLMALAHMEKAGRFNNTAGMTKIAGDVLDITPNLEARKLNEQEDTLRKLSGPFSDAYLRGKYGLTQENLDWARQQDWPR